MRDTGLKDVREIRSVMFIVWRSRKFTSARLRRPVWVSKLNAKVICHKTHFMHLLLFMNFYPLNINSWSKIPYNRVRSWFSPPLSIHAHPWSRTFCYTLLVQDIHHFSHCSNRYKLCVHIGFLDDYEGLLQGQLRLLKRVLLATGLSVDPGFKLQGLEQFAVLDKACGKVWTALYWDYFGYTMLTL